MDLKIFGGAEWIVGAAVLVLLLGSAVVVQHTELNAASAQAELDAEKIKSLNDGIKAEQANRAESERRYEKQRGIANETQKLFEHASNNAAAATSSSDRLLVRISALTAGAKQAANHPGTAASSSTAFDPYVVLPELFSKLSKRAGQLAATADERGIAGSACERSYDALTH